MRLCLFKKIKKTQNNIRFYHNPRVWIHSKITPTDSVCTQRFHSITFFKCSSLPEASIM